MFGGKCGQDHVHEVLKDGTVLVELVLQFTRIFLMPMVPNLGMVLNPSLTFYPPTYVFIFSILSFYIFYDTEKENLFEDQELSKVVIISCILMTLMFDSRMIL